MRTKEKERLLLLRLPSKKKKRNQILQFTDILRVQKAARVGVLELESRAAGDLAWRGEFFLYSLRGF